MILILDNIRSIHNVGSIFRTADAVGVKEIILGGITPSPIDKYGRKVQRFTKVSLGAEDFVKWDKVSDISERIVNLKKKKYKVWAVEQDEISIPYYEVQDIDFEKLALIIGNEVDGITNEVIDLADGVLEIPMLGFKESLNVSVSFAIVAFGLRYGKIKFEN